MHKTCVIYLRRVKEPDTSTNDRHTFFINFTSENRALSSKQVQRLVSATRKWQLDELGIQALRRLSSLWAEQPKLFWCGEEPDVNRIRRCFNDLEKIRVLNPLQRKAILVILATDVEQEQNHIRIHGGMRARKYAGKKEEGARCRPPFITHSLGNLCSRLWPELEEDERMKRRKWLSENSLHGWKWRQLDHIELALSLPHIDTKRYDTSCH